MPSRPLRLTDHLAWPLKGHWSDYVSRFLRRNKARRGILRGQLSPIATALALVAVTTISIFGLISLVGLKHGTIIYLIPVTFAATRWGLVPALAAAVAGSIAAEYFFYEPTFSFVITDPQEVVDLVLFISVAVVTSPLAASQKRQAEVALQREVDMRGLYAFSRRLASAHTATDIYSAIQDHLSELLSRKVVLLGIGHASETKVDWPRDASLPSRVSDSAAAIASGRPDAATELIVDDGNGDVWLVRAVSARTRDLGVIAIALGHGPPEQVAAIKRQVDTVLADATATLERLDFAHAISDARIRAETALLRDALIGSVSHELRTPLASIMGAATVLADAPALVKEPRLRSLAAVVREEAERLNDDIQKLLDATRISRQELQPRRQWIDPADIVNAAIEHRRGRLAGHVTVFDIQPDLPLVNVDPMLIEQALGQILDNAAKYSPPGSTIEIRACAEREQAVLSVRDEGAGLTPQEQAQIWERFFRGERHKSKITGSGLGLWIARAFVAANGGRIDAASEGPNRGTTISISLPAAEVAVSDRAHAFNE
jgi:two-component system, OmpR family, sensor histidine kinase KdpD